MVPVAIPYVSIFDHVFKCPLSYRLLTCLVPFLQKEYATEVATTLSNLGLFVDVDNGENTLPKKIRNGEVAQYNFILGA